MESFENREFSQEMMEHEGMEIYQQIVDHCESPDCDLTKYIDRLRAVDTTGQFLASTARYLVAIDQVKFEPWMASLIEGAIDRDREHRYIGSLLQAIWGEDYEDRAEELSASDNNFRRIYKRMHPEVNIM